MLTIILTAALAVSKPAQHTASRAAPANPICSKLTQNFDSNEALFSLIHDVNWELVKSAQNFHEAMAPSERQVAISEAQLRALGGTPRSQYSAYPSSSEKVAEALGTLEVDDAKYMAAGDRITTLIIANKCPPPDHVTTWFTYSERNPEGTANRDKLELRANVVSQTP